jgi:SAM-dependent methyltransferase
MDAHAWDQRYAAASLVWSAGPNQFVAAELADLSPGRALDLACGEGRNAVWLASRGWQVTGVDFSSVAVSKARALTAHVDVDHPIEWVVADVLTYEPSAHVDLVLIAYLQLEETQRRAVVRQTFRSLRVAGTFFLVGHDSTNLNEGAGGPQDAAVLYSAQDVLDDLDGEQFEVLRAGRVARVVQAGSPGHEHRGEPSSRAWDALVRLVRTG